MNLTIKIIINFGTDPAHLVVSIEDSFMNFYISNRKKEDINQF